MTDNHNALAPKERPPETPWPEGLRERLQEKGFDTDKLDAETAVRIEKTLTWEPPAAPQPAPPEREDCCTRHSTRVTAGGKAVDVVVHQPNCPDRPLDVVSCGEPVAIGLDAFWDARDEETARKVIASWNWPVEVTLTLLRAAGWDPPICCHLQSGPQVGGGFVDDVYYHADDCQVDPGEPAWDGGRIPLDLRAFARCESEIGVVEMCLDGDWNADKVLPHIKEEGWTPKYRGVDALIRKQ